MWVSIHKCMEPMLKISLYKYLYSKLAKTICLSYFLFKKSEKRAVQVLPGSRG
jgi:hypothetical protein